MSSLRILTHSRAGEEQASEHWMSVSDLMAGLMMVFLFVAIAYMHYVRIEKERIEEVAIAYQKAQISLFEALRKEFENDLPKWNAELDRTTLEVRFLSPDILFEAGKVDLRPAFKSLLADFFPRYLNVIGEFRDHIEEIRIEGHTSSDWAGVVSEEAYYLNMDLSQGRSRSVLRFVSGLPLSEFDLAWTKKHVAAVGYSSSRPVLDPVTMAEDKELSRRVSFRVITNAEVQIRKIIRPTHEDSNRYRTADGAGAANRKGSAGFRLADKHLD